MGRIKGAKNIAEFSKRKQIVTVPTRDVLHLVHSNKSPLENYHELLKHQENYLKWLNSRHDELQKLKPELNRLKSVAAKQGPKGPKDGTFRKYVWYTEQLILLEAINGLEVFYKRTIIALGNALKDLIPAEKIKGNIDVKTLWLSSETIDVAALIFEHQLFHNLETIDDATRMLIGEAYYSGKSQKIKLIPAVFQIRHTLSHNGGLVTSSDATKFKILGFKIQSGEVIDPTSDNFSISIFRFLKSETQSFSDWLKTKTLAFIKKTGGTVPIGKKDELIFLLGGKDTDTDWKTINWI